MDGQTYGSPLETAFGEAPSRPDAPRIRLNCMTSVRVALKMAITPPISITVTPEHGRSEQVDRILAVDETHGRHREQHPDDRQDLEDDHDGRGANGSEADLPRGFQGLLGEVEGRIASEECPSVGTEGGNRAPCVSPARGHTCARGPRTRCGDQLRDRGSRRRLEDRRESGSHHSPQTPRPCAG